VCSSHSNETTSSATLEALSTEGLVLHVSKSPCSCGSLTCLARLTRPSSPALHRSQQVARHLILPRLHPTAATTPTRHRLAHKRASAAKASRSSCSQSLHLVPRSALLHIILLITNTLTKCPSLRGRDVIQSLRPSPHEAHYPSLLSPDSSTTQFVPARPNIAIR